MFPFCIGGIPDNPCIGLSALVMHTTHNVMTEFADLSCTDYSKPSSYELLLSREFIKLNIHVYH